MKPGNRSTLIGASVLALLLCLSFKSESLWTDEAFSAFIACHRTYSALWHTLLAGDSSDLQMWLYYSYLHAWVSVFGSHEIALRSANIPFILIYSMAISWTRFHLFKSNWVWVAALNPFVWAYAADTRPYLCIVALSTVVVVCLVGSLSSESQILPWVALSAWLIGLNLHMLMILLLPPAIIFVLLYRLASGLPLALKPWFRPLLCLSPLFLAYFVFLAWTFGRGTNYDYAHPDLLSTGAVLFRFAGLAGFAPNRHYEVAFGPYIPGMLLAALGIAVAALIALSPAIRTHHARTLSLLAALFVGLCQAPVLSFLFKQQIEVRHIACLFALLLFLFFSAWDSLAGAGKFALPISVVLVASVWLVSDWRITCLPEYRREDFRAAVAAAIGLAHDKSAQIAVVADPASAAYYGLNINGNSPCYPLPGTCQDALRQVAWPHLHSAVQATFWTAPQITAWLQAAGEHIVLISRSRHPMYQNSAWWPALRQTRSDNPLSVHGFSVYTISTKKY